MRDIGSAKHYSILILTPLSGMPQADRLLVDWEYLCAIIT